jgi:hypothetical protein
MLMGKGWNFEVLRMRRAKPPIASPSKLPNTRVCHPGNFELGSQATEALSSSEYAEVIGIETIRSYPPAIIGPQPSNTYDEPLEMP